MSLINKYKTNMLNKMKLIRTRNQKFKKTCSKLYSRNNQYGGGTDEFGDDVKPIVNVIDFDIEIDKNNKLIDEYLTKLNSLHTIITKETPDISKKEFDKLAEELKLKEESILAQKEKIQTQIDEQKKQNLENTQQHNISLQTLEQQNAELNSTIQSIKNDNATLQQQLSNSSNSSKSNVLALEQLQNENKEYETKIANMIQLEAQLVQLQNEKTDLSTQLNLSNNSLQEQTYLKDQLQAENITLKQENANLPEKIKSKLLESLQSYDKKLIGHVEKKENVQMGGRRLKKMQKSCEKFNIRKKFQRNVKKLLKIYNNVYDLRNKFINEHMKIYVKKNNIKMTDIKKELKFLFENRSKYLNNQTIFMGGKISEDKVYNQVVSHLIDNKQLPDEHFDNIYNKLKTIIKGEVSGDSSGKDVVNNIYKAVLGDKYDINDPNQQKFLNKATTIKQIGEEIISILSDCEPPSMGVKLSSSLKKIKDQIEVLNKLEKLLTINPDSEIIRKAQMYLPTDLPTDFPSNLSGEVSDMMTTIRIYYNNQIKNFINIESTENMLKNITETIKAGMWQIEDNGVKKTLCKDISDLQKNLRIATKNLDMSYIVNKYEDISGAVRVYVRINDYAVKKGEKEVGCSTESICLGRSYVIEKEDDEETTYILARNPCEQDPFYDKEQKQKSIDQGKNNQPSTFKVINEDMLKQYQMLGVQRYGAFFGTYENVRNKDIFMGIDSKSNNPPLKDALLQATQGYSIVLFGYGYSGSGKSYTLLNGDDSMLSSFMAAVKNKAGTITIDKISELYGRYRIQDSRMEATEHDISEENLKEINGEINFKLINDIKATTREKQINILLETIESFRKTSRSNRLGTRIPATIKGTPNNPASSRSHLFIRIGVQLPNGPTGYLTIVDMAGIEDPVEIAINIFPFTDLRRKIDPFKKNRKFKSDGEWWADIDTKKFTNNNNAKKALATYFGKVLIDLKRVEEDVCPDARGRDSHRTNWKYLSDCTAGREEDRKTNSGNGYSSKYVNFSKIWPTTASIETSFKQMKEIQEQILSQAEAFTLLKDLKEVFLYGRIVNPSNKDKINPLRCKIPRSSKTKNVRDTICNSANLLENLNDLLDLWIRNLPKGSRQQLHILSLRKLKIMRTFMTKSDARAKDIECEEKYAILMNYCFGCMILNGIIKDFEDMNVKALDKDGKETGKFKIEYKLNAQKELIKQYNGGFLDGVQISESNYTELIEEGIFINETINHLAFYFKKKNKPNTKLEFKEELKEVVSSLYSTKVFARGQLKPKDSLGHRPSAWDDSIKMSLKTYLPNKFLYDPEREDGWNKNVLIKKILTELDSKSQKGKPSKFIMMCLLRPEIDAKYCTGARATLEFAESVCSTCT